MEVTQLISLLGGIGGAMGAGITLWNIIQGPNRGLAAKVTALETKVADLERKAAAIETTVQTLPTKDSMHDLQMTVERMNSDVRVLSETMKGVKETSNLVRDYLLEEKGKAA